MISETRIEELQSNLLKLYEEIEEDLLTNIAKRINFDDELGGTAAWQVRKLEELGAVTAENQRVIASKSGRTEKEVNDLFRKAGIESVTDDERIYKKAIDKGIIAGEVPAISRSEPIARILATEIQGATDAINLTNTRALQSARQDFLDIVNRTFIEVDTGISDYKSAIRRAVTRLADKGITGQTYVTDTGRVINYQLDAAVRREVVTSSLQSARQIQDARAEEYGSDLIEVTSHVGARPKCARDQGKIYSISGRSRKFPPRSSTTEGDADGLFGVNCRHQFFPYFDGLSVKRNEPEPLRKNDKIFDESQVQRKLEVSVRKEKRRLIMLNEIGDTEGFERSAVKLKQKEAKLRQFKKDTGRTQQSRTQQEGFTRSLSQKAVQANKRAKES